MTDITKFTDYLIQEGKPYSPDNFKLFAQIIGFWLEKEFLEGDYSEEEFKSKIPFYDLDFEVKASSKKPISLYDIEEQEKPNFLSFVQRYGKKGVSFDANLTLYGAFLMQLPKSSSNQAVSRIKKNFPELEPLMANLIKGGAKPQKDPAEIKRLIASAEVPRVPGKRGRKAGSKNKPKEPKEPVVTKVAGVTIDDRLKEQFKREGKVKIDELEEQIAEIHKQIDKVIEPLVKEIKKKIKEVDMRREALGLKDNL